MSFNPKITDKGTQPWEELPATAGSYKAGQALIMNNGKLKAISGKLTTTPNYISMADKVIALGDDMLPVIRVRGDIIFETELTAITAGAKPGAMLQISDGGLGVDGSATGTFEVVSLMAGTAQGDHVRGRFVCGTAAP